MDAVEFFVLLVEEALSACHAVKGALALEALFLSEVVFFFFFEVVLLEFVLKVLAVGGVGVVSVEVDEENDNDEE